jgi:hypothetical protein
LQNNEIHLHVETHAPASQPMEKGREEEKRKQNIYEYFFAFIPANILMIILNAV